MNNVCDLFIVASVFFTLSCSVGTIFEATKPLISSAFYHAPALADAAKGKNVKKLKCNQGTVLQIRKPRKLYVPVGE